MEHGGSSSLENAEAFRRRIAQLEQQLAELQATTALYHEQLACAAEQIALLKKALWAPRRERYLPDPNQQTLFQPQTIGNPSANDTAEPSAEQEADAADGDDDDEPPAAPGKNRPQRRQRNRIVFPQFLERRRREHPLPEGDRPCGCCGQERVVIQEHVSEQLEIEPARVYVAQHVRYTYACAKCRQAEQMVTPPKPPQVLEKGILGPSVAAYVLDLKFVRHVPLYRQQEMLLELLQQWLSRPLLCALMRRTAEALGPLCELIRQRVLLSFLLHVDETTIRQLERDLGQALTAYFWAYAGEVDYPYVYYDFQESRSRDGPAAILADYRGYLQTDGYSAYASLVQESQGRLIDVACWAHVRRGFDEARCTTSHPLLHEALGGVQQLYDLEDRARSWSTADRLRLRVAEAVPIVARLQARFDAVAPELRPASKLAEAVQYARNRWDALRRFTSDGRIPLDNNTVERLFRGPAVGRKNYLFVGSHSGGQTAARLYTIVQSAKRHNLALSPYLNDVLRRLPLLAADGAPLDGLLPDHWAQEHPEHVLAEREQESREARLRRIRRRAARRAGALAAVQR